MATDAARQDGQPAEAYRDIAAAHIRSLAALNARVPSILSTAATSLSQLTNGPITDESTDPSASAPDSASKRRAALSANAHSFFDAVLQLNRALYVPPASRSVTPVLTQSRHTQIDQLEKNGVIPAEDVKYRAPVQQQGPGPGPMQGSGKPQHRDSEATVTNAGLGDFDVGVLNARAGVRQRDTDEVLERTKRVLEDLAKHTD